MSIAFSPATPQRFQEICALYQNVIRDMHARGLKQWEWDVYPTRAQLEDDITHGRLYRVEDEGQLIAAFALGDAMEPEMCIRDRRRPPWAAWGSGAATPI